MRWDVYLVENFWDKNALFLKNSKISHFKTLSLYVKVEED